MYPDPIIFNINLYGIMISIGMLCCFLCLWSFSKKINLEEKFVDFLTYDAFASIGIGFLSASLFQSLYEYIENPENGFQFGVGITFIGGLIGGVITYVLIWYIFRKKFNNTLADMLTIAPICITIAHAFGRVGCFFAGCCYGVKTDSWLGVKFPDLPYKVLPTNLIEAIFLFILCGVMIYLLLKKNFNYNLPVYLISYGIFRFIIEFFRGDDRGEFLLNLSPSQFWSIIMIIAGITVIFYQKIYLEQKKKKLLS